MSRLSFIVDKPVEKKEPECSYNCAKCSRKICDKSFGMQLNIFGSSGTHKIKISDIKCLGDFNNLKLLLTTSEVFFPDTKDNILKIIDYKIAVMQQAMYGSFNGAYIPGSNMPIYTSSAAVFPMYQQGQQGLQGSFTPQNR